MARAEFLSRIAADREWLAAHDAEKAGFFAASSPLEKLTERQVLAAVEPWVRRVREEAFGSPEARWTAERYPEAVAGLEAEAGRKPPTPEERERLRAIGRQIVALELERSAIRAGEPDERERLAILSELSAREAALRQLGTVRYSRPGLEGSGRISARPGAPKLNAFVRGAVQIAEATGFSEPDVAAYLLAGLPPSLPSLRYVDVERSRNLPTGGTLWRRLLTVEVETHAPGETEVRKILKAIRDVSPENPLDEALLRILQAAGGVPERPPLSFWEGIAKRWTEAKLPEASPHALRVRFIRLLKRRPEAARAALRASA